MEDVSPENFVVSLQSMFMYIYNNINEVIDNALIFLIHSIKELYFKYNSNFILRTYLHFLEKSLPLKCIYMYYITYIYEKKS